LDVIGHAKSKKKKEERMKELAELVKRLIPPKRSKDYAYKMGKDCAKNGANTTNCHFSIFSSKENTEAWERGKNE